MLTSADSALFSASRIGGRTMLNLTPERRSAGAPRRTTIACAWMETGIEDAPARAVPVPAAQAEKVHNSLRSGIVINIPIIVVAAARAAVVIIVRVIIAAAGAGIIAAIIVIATRLTGTAAGR